MTRQSVQDVSKRKRWVEAPPGKTFCNLMITKGFRWWRNPESNWGHKDFQSSALPTELSGQNKTSVKETINLGVNGVFYKKCTSVIFKIIRGAL